MNVVKMSEVPKKPHLNPLFTGPDVTRQALAPDSKDFNVNIVNFGKGIRNPFIPHLIFAFFSFYPWTPVAYRDAYPVLLLELVQP